MFLVQVNTISGNSLLLETMLRQLCVNDAFLYQQWQTKRVSALTPIVGCCARIFPSLLLQLTSSFQLDVVTFFEW